MNNEKHNHSSSTTTRTVRRYWKRVDEPKEAWWPWGLLPLLGLLLLFLWGALKTAPDIEDDITKQVSSKLTGFGANILEADASGQEIDIVAKSNHSKNLLESIADSTRCDTWAGKLTCPTDVNVKLSQSVAAVVDQPTEKLEPLPRFHDFNFIQNGNTITLNGEVPNQTARTALIAAAKSKFSQVTDNLRISSEMATKSYPLAYQKGLNVLSHLRSGEAKWSHGVFSVDGQVNEAKNATANQAYSLTPAPNLGGINLQIVKSANTCNSEFEKLLTTSTINFRTNSAEINPSSQGLLESLATLAKKCPGTLQVEGHTDSQGAEEYNQDLSQRRAMAVRAALATLSVDIKRLQARGFGESQPIADNSTPTGRAQNRRIVIKIAP